MFRNIRQLSWIGLTLTMGMVSCHFPQSSEIEQVNSSSTNSETLSQCTDTQIREWIYVQPLNSTLITERSHPYSPQK